MSAPRVLLVTGAYYPEISAAGRLAQSAARALAGRVEFTVVTTAVAKGLPPREVVDGVVVHRIAVDVERPLSRLRATARLAAAFAGLQRRIDLVHVHGFSSKNVPIAILGRMCGKPLVMTLHTAGQDDPGSVRARGSLAAWAYRAADLYLTVSPQQSDLYCASGMPPAKLQEVPNGVDTARFTPATAAERQMLRRELGLPPDRAIVLFVGFFSRDKRPDMLFDAWMRQAHAGRDAALVCVGATASRYYEVDPSLAARMRAGADRAGLADRLMFVEPTHAVERYFRAADLFALPSAREAAPMALLEAMACGLPVVATRLPRATDAIVDDGVNGLLFDDADGLAAALDLLLRDRERAAAIGRAARKRIVEAFDVKMMAGRWLAAYERVLPGARRRETVAIQHPPRGGTTW